MVKRSMTICIASWAFVLFSILVGSSARGQESSSPRCDVCQREIPNHDHDTIHRGRTVHLCSKECAAAFTADPEAYFAKLQPRGALFQESAQPQDMMPRGGFWFGVYVLMGLVFGAIAAYAAIHRGRPAGPWFFAGLFFNVWALAALLVRPTKSRAGPGDQDPEGVPSGLRKVPVTRDPTTCPNCGLDNHPSARKCSHCGAELSPTAQSEVDVTNHDVVKGSV